MEVYYLVAAMCWMIMKQDLVHALKSFILCSFTGYPGEMIQWGVEAFLCTSLWGVEAFCTSFFRFGGKFLALMAPVTLCPPLPHSECKNSLLKEGIWQGGENRNGSATI